MATTSDSQSQYDQDVKQECRSKLIEHAVRCLTTERNTSACVQRDHVRRVWQQLRESGEAEHYFYLQQRQDIEREIEQWELFHDSQIQTRKPSDLRVCYLAGDNPINDLEVLTDLGVLTQNVWAVEKDSETLKKAWQSINRSKLRNVRLFEGDILNFLKDFEGQFDIIYYDACGALPSKQNTLKFIGYVFMYNKLASPGALITNFSFPPELTADVQNASAGDKYDERREITDLSREYLKYRLCNTSLEENYPDLNAELLSKKTDEEIYSDYITYQVIDSAYLYIPAQRMLSSTRSGRACPLWEQMFLSKEVFLAKAKTYTSATSPSDSESSSIEAASKSADSKSREEALSKFAKLQDTLDPTLKDIACESYLRMIGDAMNSPTASNRLRDVWIKEIFPDWKSSALKDRKISSLLLTHLLSSSQEFIYRFSNPNFQQKCLGPISKACEEGSIPRFCDVPNGTVNTKLVGGLLYGQMAYPSFPVVDKLLRLHYTAKKRQMFSDVFIFDKCRYVYEQFPSVDCSIFAIYELQQQMVFRMVVDGLRKHLESICCCDLFKSCHVASKNEVIEGGVNFYKDSEIPERQITELCLFNSLREKGERLVEARRFDEAVKCYDKCQGLYPENPVIYSNRAQCFLKLNQPERALSDCDKALSLDQGNIKALFRRAMAFKMLKKFPSAVGDLEKLLTIDQDNKDAKRELTEIRKKIQV